MMRYCQIPEEPKRELGHLSRGRERLIRVHSKKWVNGTVLKYHLADTNVPQQRELTRAGFKVWTDVGLGLGLVETSARDEAEIRVSFDMDGSAWSVLGRDAIDHVAQGEPTLNLGWPLKDDPRGKFVATHELGHALGLPHEHQNPFSGLVWSEDDVYRYFAGPPNHWPQQVTHYNILRKLSTTEVQGSNWDKDSIMHYEFPGGLILEPPEFTNGLVPAGGLSQTDIEQIAAFYPSDVQAPTKLEPFNAVSLSLSSGEQVNFSLTVPAIRNYRLGTFGNSDTVIVLFERFKWTDRGGTEHDDFWYLDGDDDSGESYNSLVRVKLYPWREYELRVKLYSQWADGNTVVMMW